MACAAHRFGTRCRTPAPYVDTRPQLCMVSLVATAGRVRLPGLHCCVPHQQRKVTQKVLCAAVSQHNDHLNNNKRQAFRYSIYCDGVAVALLLRLRRRFLGRCGTGACKCTKEHKGEFCD